MISEGHKARLEMLLQHRHDERRSELRVMVHILRKCRKEEE